MTKSPEKVYGFEYQVGASTFVFDVQAGSAEQAKERVAAMAAATFAGELILSQPQGAA